MVARGLVFEITLALHRGSISLYTWEVKTSLLYKALNDSWIALIVNVVFRPF